jgi:hypothetical protein
MAAHQVSSLDIRIDWELLPSLRAALRAPRRRSDPIWQETEVLDFEPPCQPAQFEEVMPGLAVREVTEPEIFRIFFGRPTGARSLS